MNKTGINFGPDLSDIGSKYGKAALYSNILDPGAGITFGYEGYLIKTKDGKALLGYIISETNQELTINMIGGVSAKIKITDIISKKPYEYSLMPSGLLDGLKKQEVSGLIEYLASLKEKN